MTAGDAVSDADRRFILHDLEQLPTRAGLARAAHFHGRLDRLGQVNLETHEVTEPRQPVFYRCPHFEDDPESAEYGLCRNYDDRPPMCSGFPWYGRGPDPRKGLPLDCSFRIDLIEKP